VVAPPALIGAAGRVQLRRSTEHATPTDHDSYLQQPERQREQFWCGGTSFGIKYRFINAGEDDWRLQIANYSAPRGLVFLPVGLGFGTSHAFLPLWIPNDFGP
jgi:hypothetical protein